MGTLKFDQYQREAQVEPLKVETAGGEVIEIPVPNGEQFMDAEEAGSTRRALRIVCDSAWPKIQPLVNSIEDPEALRDFVRDVMKHFRMTGDEAPNAGGPR